MNRPVIFSFDLAGNAAWLEGVSISMRLLVVEDNPTLRRQLLRELREESYAVDEAADGQEAWYKMEQIDYELIILDVMLPEANGWDLLDRLRKIKATPVLMLTARDSVGDRIRGLDLGADDYLPKPFDMEELLARVRSLIRRSHKEVKPEIEIGSVTVDTSAQRVYLDGEETVLTAKEYAIVQKLSLSRGKVVSTQELLEAILDEEDDSMSNLLNVHLFNIRKKLGKDFVTTLRGQGYRTE